MEIAGIIIPMWIVFAGMGAVCAFGPWTLASTEHKKKRSKQTWDPDVDQTKAETLQNHPGGFNH